MLSMFKIIGDLIGGYAVHIVGAIGAIWLASAVLGTLASTAASAGHYLG